MIPGAPFVFQPPALQSFPQESNGTIHATPHEKPKDDGTIYATPHEKPKDDGTIYAVPHEKPKDDGTIYAVPLEDVLKAQNSASMTTPAPASSGSPPAVTHNLVEQSGRVFAAGDKQSSSVAANAAQVSVPQAHAQEPAHVPVPTQAQAPVVQAPAQVSVPQAHAQEPAHAQAPTQAPAPVVQASAQVSVPQAHAQEPAHVSVPTQAPPPVAQAQESPAQSAVASVASALAQVPAALATVAQVSAPAPAPQIVQQPPAQVPVPTQIVQQPSVQAPVLAPAAVQQATPHDFSSLNVGGGQGSKQDDGVGILDALRILAGSVKEAAKVANSGEGGAAALEAAAGGAENASADLIEERKKTEMAKDATPNETEKPREDASAFAEKSEKSKEDSSEKKSNNEGENKKDSFSAFIKKKPEEEEDFTPLGSHFESRLEEDDKKSNKKAFGTGDKVKIEIGTEATKNSVDGITKDRTKTARALKILSKYDKDELRKCANLWDVLKNYVGSEEFTEMAENPKNSKKITAFLTKLSKQDREKVIKITGINREPATLDDADVEVLTIEESVMEMFDTASKNEHIKNLADLAAAAEEILTPDIYKCVREKFAEEKQTSPKKGKSRG
jgi:hypothetical protein